MWFVSFVYWWVWEKQLSAGAQKNNVMVFEQFRYSILQKAASVFCLKTYHEGCTMTQLVELLPHSGTTGKAAASQRQKPVFDSDLGCYVELERFPCDLVRFLPHPKTVQVCQLIGLCKIVQEMDAKVG